MATIYITFSLKKKISRQKNLLKEILREVGKFDRGAKNLVDLYSPAPDMKVLKAYLSSGKVRAAILLRVSRKVYIPFFVAKKESEYGWNLSKYSEDILASKILKTADEIKTGKYQQYQL